MIAPINVNGMDTQSHNIIIPNNVTSEVKNKSVP